MNPKLVQLLLATTTVFLNIVPTGASTPESVSNHILLQDPQCMFSSVQSLSHVQLFATPRNASCQASLSITNSGSLLKLMSIESVMPSNHLIFCRTLLLLPSIFPSSRVFSSESALHIRWPKYRRFSFSISPSNEYSELISFRIDWFDCVAVQGILKSLLERLLLNHERRQDSWPLEEKNSVRGQR